MLTIGQLAAKTGIPETKIRYYEKIGVLPAPDRSPNGYRAYSDQDLARLGLLQRGKILGLTLAELADLLRAADEGCCDTTGPLVAQHLRDKLVEVDHQLDQLQALRCDLTDALRRLDDPAPASAGGTDVGCTSPCEPTVTVTNPRR